MKNNSFPNFGSQYERLSTEFRKRFPKEKSPRLFSAPGRIELCGNHTDHNGGHAIAAGIDLDVAALVFPTDEPTVELFDLAYYCPLSVDLTQLKSMERKGDERSALNLIRGIAAFFSQEGFPLGGFSGIIESRVTKGSGLSSSASFEVLIATVFNGLYSEGKISLLDLARAGQFSENNYMNKPSGILDQIASAYGVPSLLDFSSRNIPTVKPFTWPFPSHSPVVVDTGVSHRKLLSCYASIAREMKLSAAVFGKEILGEIDENLFYKEIHRLKKERGDRCVLRSIHFFEEKKRVKALAEILSQKSQGENDLKKACSILKDSGHSSLEILQNGYNPETPEEQGLVLGVIIGEQFLRNNNITGVVKLVGGGFAGSILALLPQKAIPSFTELMDRIFSKGCTTILQFRETPAGEILP